MSVMDAGILADTSAVLTVDPYLGPFLIGTVVCAIFFGILCLQVHIYIKRTPNKRALSLDGWLIPLTCLLLNAINLLAAIWSCYDFLVTHFGDLSGGVFGVVPWGITANLILTGLSNSIVQSWFLWRIWLRSRKNKLLVGTLGLGIVVTWALMLALGSESAAVHELGTLPTISWLFYVSLAFDAVTNFGITAALSVYLSRTRRSPLYGWDYIISVPVIYVSNTGILCLIVIFLTFLMRLIRRHDYIFFGIFLTYSTLYANGLLGYMNSVQDDNSRASLRPCLPLTNRPGNGSSGVAIHADMQRALDATTESPGTMDIPLSIHVEKSIDKEDMLL